MGSTLPLAEQGNVGRHLSKTQITDPLSTWYESLPTSKQIEWDTYLNEYKAKSQNIHNPMTDQQLANVFANIVNNQRKETGESLIPTPEMIEKVAPSFNAWKMGPYQNYIRNQLATGLPHDTLLEKVNSADIPLSELSGENALYFDRAEQANRFRADSLKGHLESQTFDPMSNSFVNFDPNAPQNINVGKQTATTEPGKQYENVLDTVFLPKRSYSFDKEDFPFLSNQKMNNQVPIYDAFSSGLTSTGNLFHLLDKKVLSDLAFGNVLPENISKETPATVMGKIIEDFKKEQRQKQLNQNLKDEWLTKRIATMPIDTEFSDGSKMTIITPEMANADEAMTARDLGQITVDLNQCIGAGCHNSPDYPGVHGPYVVPHTGKPPRGKVEYDHYGYLRRLKNGEIEVGSLKDPSGVSQVTIELKPEKINLRDKEKLISDWFKSNDMLDAKTEFTDNIINFGLESAIKNALQLYSILENVIDSTKQKSIQQIKGHSNNEIKEEYVPQMVEWLNKNADNLTDVRDLDKLPGVHDLTRSYDSVGKMVDQHPHWYSPTVEQFFDEIEKEKGLPRFFTTDDFALKATERGVDLSAEPPKQLKDWEKQHISEELYLVLNKKPESLFLQNNFKDEMAEPLKLIIGDETPGVELPMEVHGKLAEMLLDHNGKYKDILDSALAQIAENGPNDWVNQFTEPQKQKMLNIMAGWFDKYPSKKLPTNTDFENAIAKHPNPFDEIKFYDQDWDKAPDNYWKHPETFGNTNGLVEALRNMEPELEQQLPFDRPEFPEPLAQNMSDYFEGRAHNVPENMIEPYATETRILMGNQRPEARLPIGVHRVIVEALLNQDNRTDVIRRAINGLQLANTVNGIDLTLPQAENALNMLIDWTERYPLNE
jgi:hypothetical protein